MFHTLLYEPVYNLLVFFLSVVPQHDIGIYIILVTVLVKAILFPLNISATRSQYALKRIDKEIKEIKEQYKNKPQEAGAKTLELYKREKISPFSSLFTIILQIPVFIALYLVFSKGIHNDVASLYSFVMFPDNLHTNAFGFLDVTKKNIAVGIITGMSAYLLARRQSSSFTAPSADKKEPSFQESFQSTLRIQLLYIFPVIILVTSSIVPAAIGVYWITSNILGIFQDWYIKREIMHVKV